MKKISVQLLAMSLIVVTLTMCTETPKTPSDLLQEKIQGAWYCGNYYKYINFMESNVMYYEHPNEMGSGFTNEYGEFFFEDSIVYLSYNYAESQVLYKYSVEFADNKMVLIDKKTGNEYVYHKVIAEKEIKMGESKSLEDWYSATIFDFEAYQSVLLCDKKATTITGFSEGVGFLTLLTNQGEVVLRLQVEQNDKFTLPDFTVLLDLDKTHIRSLLGIPYFATPNQEDYMLDYFYNSSLMENITIMMDTSGSAVRFLVVKLTDSVNKTDVAKQLKKDYTFLGDDGIDLMCYIPDPDATEFMAMKFLIVYSREDNTVFFMNASEME